MATEGQVTTIGGSENLPVLITDPVDEQLLMYDAAEERWVNRTGGPGGGAVSVNLSSDATGVLQAAQEPAHSGDVTNTQGSLALVVGAGKITNAMLAGSIAASKLVGSDLTIAESQVTSLVSDLSTLAAAITAEASTRATADSTEVSARTTAVSAEATARDAAIAAAIATEVTNRNTAVAAGDTTEVTNRNTAIGVETSARVAADASEVTARDVAIAVETSARTTADSTEVTNRNTAIATEATARDVAIAVETTARVAADALKANLASPALTGTPTAPTAAPGTNTTQLASTAFVLANPAPPVPVVQVITLTGTQADLVLTANVTQVRLNNASLLTISGMAAGVAGQQVSFLSVGAGQVEFMPQAAGTGSAAANRLINYATIGNTPLAAGTGAAVYEYDATATRWRLLAHDQGAMIAVPFAAGDFTSSSGTFVPISGGTYVHKYYLRGRILTLTLYTETATITGTPATIAMAVPGSYRATSNQVQFASTTVNGTSAVVPAMPNGASSGTSIDFFPTAAPFSGTWAAAAAACRLVFTLQLEVQ